MDTITKSRVLIFALIVCLLLAFGCTSQVSKDILTEQTSIGGNSRVAGSEISSNSNNSGAVSQQALNIDENSQNASVKSVSAPVKNEAPLTTEKDFKPEVDACEHCSYSLGLCTYDSTCLYSLAESIEDCAEIYLLVGASSNKFDTFTDRCVAQLAIKENSITICSKANTKIGDCAPKVVSTVSDLGFCDSIDSLNLNGYTTKQCYLDVAKKDVTFDVKLCDKIFGLNYDECYSVVAITQNRLALCGELSNATKKQQCVDAYIVKNRKNDLLLCNQSSNSGACARDVLVELGGSVTKDQCKQLRDEITGVGHDTYSKCFNTVALRDLDIDSCNQITYQDSVKEECINKVNHALGLTS